jgi:hypothetical protein
MNKLETSRSVSLFIALALTFGIVSGALGFKFRQDTIAFNSQEFALAIDSGRGCGSDVFQKGVHAYLTEAGPRYQAVKRLVLGEQQYNAKRTPPGKLRYAHDLRRAEVLSHRMPSAAITNLFCQSARYDIDGVRIRELVPIAMAVLDKRVGDLTENDGFLITCGVANTTGRESKALNAWLDGGESAELLKLCSPPAQ